MKISCFVFAFFIQNLFGDQPQLKKTDIQDKIETYFQSFNYKEYSIVPIETKGATNCCYFLLTIGENKFFVKYGDKVDEEILVQKKLEQKDIELPFPMLEEGTSEEKNILVRKYLKENNYGFDQVEDLYTKEKSLENFLDFQNQVFHRLNLIYHKRIPNYSPPSSKLYSKKIYERLDELVKDNAILKFHYRNDLTLSCSTISLSEMPINLVKGSEIYSLPSLQDMVKSFAQLMDHLPELQYLYPVHGDFHAPNVIKEKNGDIFFIDLAAFKFDEDPCWDLAKWLAYINKWHTVFNIRNTLREDSLVKFDFLPSSINKEVLIIDAPLNVLKDYNKISNAAFTLFADLINEDRDLIKVRTYAAEFVINFSYLRRHIHFFPILTKRVIYYCADSYLEFLKAYNEYAEVHKRKVLSAS